MSGSKPKENLDMPKKDKEYWEKELYNCKNSPIYYWKNFGTKVWPPTNEDMAEFLKEIGMDKLSAADNEEAEKLWAEQKLKMKESLKFITVDHLKERKMHLDLLKNEYNSYISKLEKEVESFVRLVDSNNVPLPDKKRCGNLVEKIRKVLPVHKKYSDKYRTSKGKWDMRMLFVTDYSELLKIYYDILRDSNRITQSVDSSTK